MNKIILSPLICAIFVFVVGPIFYEYAAAHYIPPEVLDRSKSSIVGILNSSPDDNAKNNISEQKGFSFRGSGIYVEGGYIITARHAALVTVEGKIGLASQLRILTSNFFETEVTYVGANEFADIIVYRVHPEDVPYMPPPVVFANKEPIVGEFLFSIGYPLGWGPTTTFGYMNDKNTYIPTVSTRLIKLDLVTCNGNSGGGLFNNKGEVVGIMNAIIQSEHASGSEGCGHISFAVPASVAEKTINAIISSRNQNFSRMGVEITLSKVGKYWVTSVRDAGGPAKKAGIKKGDSIISVDGNAIRDPADLKNYIVEHTIPGQTIVVRIRHGRDTVEVNVVLGDYSLDETKQ